MAADLHTLAAARLRQVQQRYTAGRRTIVDVLAAAGRPMTAGELVATDRRLPQSTVYRSVSILEQAGVVRRVVGGDEFARFELAEELTGHHHHHLVCVQCGSVEDVELPRRVEQGLDRWFGTVATRTGFRPETHRLDLLGTCATCAG